MAIKHGTVCETTGMIFWSYDSDGNERWFDPARYLFLKNRAAASRKRSYHKDIESSRAKSRQNAERIGKARRAHNFKRWASVNKERTRDNRLRAAYGITAVDYDRMLAGQGGGCAICGSLVGAVRKSGTVHMLCVDHCHETGIVRGLLCCNCNVAIGKLKDSPELLIKAANYVAAHKPKETAA